MSKLHRVLHGKTKTARLGALKEIARSGKRGRPQLRKALEAWDREVVSAAARHLLGADPVVSDVHRVLAKINGVHITRKVGWRLIKKSFKALPAKSVKEFCDSFYPPEIQEAARFRLRGSDDPGVSFFCLEKGLFLSRANMRGLDSIDRAPLTKKLRRLEHKRLRAIFSDTTIARYLRKRGVDRGELFPEKVRGPYSIAVEKLATQTGLGHRYIGAYIGWWPHIAQSYNTFSLPKRGGGKRTITAPDLSLRKLQRAILNHMLVPAVQLSPACHGFVPGRSAFTGASAHVGKRFIVNVDIKDFFPSITSPRVYGIWRGLGMTVAEARILTMLTTTNDQLPQGAPTSPMLANCACRRLDRRLLGLASSVACDYTRYADDMTFSGDHKAVSILPAVNEIVGDEGFRINEKKTRVMRRGRRQEVTGLTVNSQVSVPRAVRRRIRAAVHQYITSGSATWKGDAATRVVLEGLLAYLHTQHPSEARALRAALRTADPS